MQACMCYSTHRGQRTISVINSSPPTLLEAAAPFHCHSCSLLVREVLGSSYLPLPACCRNTGIPCNVWLYVSSGDLKSGLYFWAANALPTAPAPYPSALSYTFQAFSPGLFQQSSLHFAFPSFCMDFHSFLFFYSFLPLALVSRSLQLLSWKLR